MLDVTEDKNDKYFKLEEELRIILLGRTGSGKSATGNSILGRNEFHSDVTSTSITSKCQRGTGCRFGFKLQVIDTPGLFDTGEGNEVVTREILKCIALTAPGPHVFLLIVAIGRFTKEEHETVQLLQDVFGATMHDHLIVIFTGKDVLDNAKKSITDLLSSAPETLKRLVNVASNRYIAICNHLKDDDNDTQIKGLIAMIENMIKTNAGRFYNTEIFQEAENIVRSREKELESEFETSLAKRIEDIKRSLLDEQKFRQRALLDQLTEKENSLMGRHTAKQQISYLERDIENMCIEIEPENFHVNQKANLLDFRDKVFEAKIQLQQLRVDFHLKTEQEGDLEDEESISQQIFLRDCVRKEIEKGNSNLIQKLWMKVRPRYDSFVRGFISIFEKLKTNLR